MELIDDLSKETEGIFNKKIFDLFNLDVINDYYIYLKDNSLKAGFFSLSDNNKIASRHIYECLVYIYYLNKIISVSHETHIIDVGSGPGLPGFLFYCLKEKPKISLLDSSERRLKWIEKYSSERNIEISFVYKRAEEYLNQFDLVVYRALIPFPFSVKLVRHLSTKYICNFAGKISLSEREEKYLKSLNIKDYKILKIEELKFLGERNLIMIFLENNSKKMKPANWKIIRSEMKYGIHHSNSESKRRGR